MFDALYFNELYAAFTVHYYTLSLSVNWIKIRTYGAIHSHHSQSTTYTVVLFNIELNTTLHKQLIANMPYTLIFVHDKDSHRRTITLFHRSRHASQIKIDVFHYKLLGVF